MRVAPKIELAAEEKSTLLEWPKGRKTQVRIAERARIALMASEGKQDLTIAATLGITPKKVARWRKRFLSKGLSGLKKDAPRPGRTPTIKSEVVAEIIRRTSMETPARATHWSQRS